MNLLPVFGKLAKAMPRDEGEQEKVLTDIDSQLALTLLSHTIIQL